MNKAGAEQIRESNRVKKKYLNCKKINCSKHFTPILPPLLAPKIHINSVKYYILKPPVPLTDSPRLNPLVLVGLPLGPPKFYVCTVCISVWIALDHTILGEDTAERGGNEYSGILCPFPTATTTTTTGTRRYYSGSSTQCTMTRWHQRWPRKILIFAASRISSELSNWRFD